MQVWKFAGAGEHLAAPGDAGLPRRPGRRDLGLDYIVYQRRVGAAGLFDLLELRPRGFAQFPGQSLDPAGSCGGV